MMLPGLGSLRPPPLGEMSPRSPSPRDYGDRRDSSGDERYSVRSERSGRYRHHGTLTSAITSLRNNLSLIVGHSPRSERGYRV